MKKAFYAFLILLLFFFSFATKAWAQKNFSTDYNVTYSVSSNANTNVNLSGVLTNLTDKYYASSYSVTVGFTDIKNLKASDSEGSIAFKITKKANGSVIFLDFNKNVVGLNNKLNFNISFDTFEVAKNFNNTWDINIPGISSENDFSSFNVTVNYPEVLGKPSFIKPVLLNQTASQANNKLFFTKQDLGNSGISIAFGNFQIYNLDLKYHLENKNLFPISTEIALPPNTNYQDVAIDKITPKPVNVRVDKDGNWLAQYILSSSQIISVNVLGKAKVFLNPKSEGLDTNQVREYLKQQQYWNSENPKIKELAKELKTPYAIYQYVVKTLTYDFSRVETNSPRLGSLEALEKPNSAVCLEFTDLFIALARAAGIPAREIDGYAYTSNTSERPLSLVKDVLHAWPEYYDFDKKAWIMVDPTWGNTTGGVDYFTVLDFNHVAFVIKGQNSNYPVPAGGYKLSGSLDTKDVAVSIGSSFAAKAPKLNADFMISDTLISGIPTQGFVKISNSGSFLAESQEVDVATNYLTPKNQAIFTNSIPPFGYQLIALNFDRTPVLTNATDTIRITINNNAYYKNVKILPFFVNKLFFIGGILVVSTLIIISLIAYSYRRIHFLRQKRRSDIRGKSS